MPKILQEIEVELRHGRMGQKFGVLAITPFLSDIIFLFQGRYTCDIAVFLNHSHRESWLGW
jgi:hypothetical protein